MPTLYWPFSTSQVSEWPGPRKGSYHYGTDFAVAQGSILKATVDGVITRHNSDGFGAYVLDIMSDDGLLVRNGHLSRMDVSTGQRVKAGQIIGLTGGRPGTPGAGNSFGPHLHWELRRDRLWSGGAWIDPRNLNPQPLNFGEIPAPQPSGEEIEEMKRAMRYVQNGIDYVIIGEPLSGWAYEYTTRESAFNARMVETFQTGSIQNVDISIYNAFKRSLAEVRQGK